jgi:hypothetical protein
MSNPGKLDLALITRLAQQTAWTIVGMTQSEMVPYLKAMALAAVGEAVRRVNVRKQETGAMDTTQTDTQSLEVVALDRALTYYGILKSTPTSAEVIATAKKFLEFLTA